MVTCDAFCQESLKALIGFLDVIGLYIALTQLTYRNISQNHKFQAVGLCKIFKLHEVFLYNYKAL